MSTRNANRSALAKLKSSLATFAGPKSKHFTDEQLCKFLNMALIGIENLQSVKSAYKDQQRAAGKTIKMTFSQYVEMLYSKAAIYDAGKGRKSNTKSRSVNFHQFNSDNEDDGYDGTEDFTSETEVDSILEVMMMNSNGNGSK